MIADKIAALYAANAISAALFGRQEAGNGATIEVPMFEGLASFVMTEHMAAASFSQESAPGYHRLLNPHRRRRKVSGPATRISATRISSTSA